MVRIDGPIFVVQFLFKKITQPLGPPLGIKRMWTKRNDNAPKKMNLFWYMSKKGSFEKFRFGHSFAFSYLHLLFPKKSLKSYYSNASLSWAFAFFYHSTSFTSPTAKLVKPCQRMMQALKCVFRGPQIPWSLWHFFPKCKPKWSRDKFNNHSQILQGLGTNSWSLV